MAKRVFTSSSIFDSFQDLRKDAGIRKNNWNWFRSIVNQTVQREDTNQIRDMIASDPERRRQRLFVGQLYFFFYNL